MIHVVPVLTWVVVDLRQKRWVVVDLRQKRMGGRRRAGITGPASDVTRYRMGARKLGITTDEYAAHVEAGEKWCSGCKRWQSRDEFCAARSRRDGLNTVCQQWMRQYVRAYAETKPRPKLTQEQRSEAVRQSAPARMATRLGITEAEWLAHQEGGERRCSWHKTWHPASVPFSHRNICRAGNTERMRAYYAANRDRMATYSREYQRKRAAEKRREAV